MKLVHVTIQTKYFEEEIRFYTDQIGLKIQRDMRTRGMNIVFLADEAGDTEIEIIQNPSAEQAGNQNLSIGFRMEDVSRKRKELVDAGFSATEMMQPAPDVAFFFVTDPAGVQVQLI